MASVAEFLKNAGTTVSTAATAAATATTAAADRWAEQRVGRSAPTPATATPARSPSAPAVVPESLRNPEPGRSATTPAASTPATSWTQQATAPQTPQGSWAQQAQGPQQAPHGPREQRRNSREAEPARSPWSGGGGKKGKGKGVLPTILGAGLLAGTIALSIWVQGVLGPLAMAATLVVGGTIALTFSGLLGDVNKDGKVDVRDTMTYLSRAIESTLQGGAFSIAVVFLTAILGIGNLKAWINMSSGTAIDIAMVTALWAGISFIEGLHSWYWCTRSNTNRTLVLLSRDQSLSPDLSDRTAPEAEAILERRRQSFHRFLKVLSFASLGAMAAEIVIVGNGNQVLQGGNPLKLIEFVACVCWTVIGIRSWGSFRDQILSPEERQALADLNDDSPKVQLRRS